MRHDSFVESWIHVLHYWCVMGYENGLLKIFWMYMMSVLQIHLENIPEASGVVLKTNFYAYGWTA